MDRAKLSHELKVVVGHPSELKYNYMTSNKLLPDCPSTTKYITNKKSIVGMNLAGVRGNTVIHNPSRVETKGYLIILLDF